MWYFKERRIPPLLPPHPSSLVVCAITYILFRYTDEQICINQKLVILCLPGFLVLRDIVRRYTVAGAVVQCLFHVCPEVFVEGRNRLTDFQTSVKQKCRLHARCKHTMCKYIHDSYAD